MRLSELPSQATHYRQILTINVDEWWVDVSMNGVRIDTSGKSRLFSSEIWKICHSVFFFSEINPELITEEIT